MFTTLAMIATAVALLLTFVNARLQGRDRDVVAASERHQDLINTFRS